jgi:hypothetical protein
VSSYGLTTLGKILIEESKQQPDRFDRSFKEAFGYLDEAIKLEGSMNRLAIHPYLTMFVGTSNYLKQTGRMTTREMETLQSHMDNAEKFFGYDSQFISLIGDLRHRINNP